MQTPCALCARVCAHVRVCHCRCHNVKTNERSVYLLMSNQKKRCKCGSVTHLRSKHQDCPLNTKVTALPIPIPQQPEPTQSEEVVSPGGTQSIVKTKPNAFQCFTYRIHALFKKHVQSLNYNYRLINFQCSRCTTVI